MQERITAEQIERDVLNRLMQTCRDGELGFRYAANHVRNPDVNTLFLELANQRDACAGEILPHAQRLGGAAERDGSVAGALHRGWITIKDTVGAHEDTVIIREAELRRVNRAGGIRGCTRRHRPSDCARPRRTAPFAHKAKLQPRARDADRLSGSS